MESSNCSLLWVTSVTWPVFSSFIHNGTRTILLFIFLSLPKGIFYYWFESEKHRSLPPVPLLSHNCLLCQILLTGRKLPPWLFASRIQDCADVTSPTNVHDFSPSSPCEHPKATVWSLHTCAFSSLEQELLEDNAYPECFHFPLRTNEQCFLSCPL